MVTVRTDEGQRVLRNAVSIGAFLMSPLTLALMVRALGQDGYGRWWWTFVLLEAAAIIGMVGADLFVRRELPTLQDEAGEAAAVEIVGTGLALMIVTGTSFALLQIALADVIATAQGDRELAPFMAILAFQPLLWNLGTLLGAAVQSRHRLGILAVIRGLLAPVLNAVVYYVSWQWALRVRTTLYLMLAITIVALIPVVALYGKHFPIGRTLRCALRPRRMRVMLAYSARMIAPLVLFTIGGKIDIYALGAFYPAVVVGIYAACLQMSSGIPNIRALFDPVVQAQIGDLHRKSGAELATSLRRLARLCVFALAPAFVVTVAVGEPILGWLLGHRDPNALEPLLILSVGQLIASAAIASWLVSMVFAGRLLTVIAAAALAVKVALLVALVPRYGASGAAIATAAGAIVAMQAQAMTGSRRFSFWPYQQNLIPVLVATIAIAALGHGLFELAESSVSELFAVTIAGTASLGCLVAALLALLDASERASLRELFGWRR